jgi:hypothetical protein
VSETADTLAPGDPRWADLLAAAPHDFHHLPAYAELSARHEGAAPAALFAEAGGVRALVPLLVRDVPAALGAGRDAVSPYGYPAPLFAPEECDGAEARRCVALLREAGVSAGLTAAFVRLHPLLPTPLDALATAGEVVAHGPTVYIDLAADLGAIERGVRSGTRYDVRKLVKAGFTLDLDEWTLLPAFGEVYRDTMRRVGATREYLFDDGYFAGLRRALGDRLHLAAVRAPGGALAAAGLFTECAGIGQYHLSGTAEPFVSQAPTKLMLWEMTGWAHQRGLRALHLGGGVGGREDSLFNFKAGFSGLRATFRSWRLVCDSAHYEALVARRRAAARDAAAPAGFFPAYRAPLPAA